jgi:hypothetical protein
MDERAEADALDGAAQGYFYAHARGSRRLAMGYLGGHRFWPSYRLPGFPATLFERQTRAQDTNDRQYPLATQMSCRFAVAVFWHP